MAILHRVRAFAKRHELWGPDTRVIAAVSGGADSTALFLLLHELATQGELMLDAIAHLHHGIRGAAADDDETLCRALAAEHGVPYVSARADVPALAHRDRVSIEVAGRRARYTFFEDVRRTRGADRIATAHTRDDQAETVILRLVRGVGLKGLAGIAPSRGSVIRPLLGCGRDELRAYLRGRDRAWREDATNLDASNPRNRIRHEVLPYLAEHFNPAIGSALARLADHARTDDASLAKLTEEAAARLLHVEDGLVSIDSAGLAALSPGVARRVIRHALETARPGFSSYLHEIDLVRAVAAGEAQATELGSLRVERLGTRVVLVQRRVAPAASTAFRYHLPIPGTVHLREAGWRVDAEGPRPWTQAGWANAQPPRDRMEVTFAADKLNGGLVVRSREPGDRLRPLGLSGRKKVQDLFIDRKVHRDERDRTPIVTDEKGRIIWVAGHVLAEEFRVTEATNAVVVLKLRRL